MNTTTITLKDTDVTLLSLKETAEQLMNSRLDADEFVGDVRLECGCDLEVDIRIKCEGDKRCSDYLSYTETFTISDIQDEFTAADYYCWAKDADGDDVLACFGC